jgi:hypothetical protein
MDEWMDGWMDKWLDGYTTWFKTDNTLLSPPENIDGLLMNLKLAALIKKN